MMRCRIEVMRRLARIAATMHTRLWPARPFISAEMRGHDRVSAFVTPRRSSLLYSLPHTPRRKLPHRDDYSPSRRAARTRRDIADESRARLRLASSATRWLLLYTFPAS